MKTINAKKVKVGNSYFFPNTHFDYGSQFITQVEKAKVYRVISGDFSTKNDGDKYEVERVFGFENEIDAKKYLVKQIKERVKNLRKEALVEIKKLNA